MITQVYSDCRSVLVFLFSYIDQKKSLTKLASESKIASYTLGFEGVDYHHWVSEKLNTIGESLQDQIKGLDFKISLDIHPVLERDLAYRAGLGWFGKNSMLISQEKGSYTIIGSLLLNKELEIETRKTVTDHCGNCTRCLDACPTGAILDNKTIDSNKCISTFTIELFKDAPAPEGYPVESGEIFGCDICQEVCPWNNKPLALSSGQQSDNKLVDFFNRSVREIYDDIEGMSNNDYKRFFMGTSFVRSGKRGLLKNLKPYLTKI